MVTVSRRVQAMVFGGPSMFRVKQDVVNDFNFTDSYPFDEATFTGGVTNTVSKSKIGFNVGADVSYFFTPQLGVGGTAQYSGTNLDITSAGGDTVDIRAGGFQAGGGVRLRF
jgi:opacity protein-like surface antigen